MNFLGTFLAIFAFVGLFVLALNIGYIFKKREFRGSCASNNPIISDKIGNCPVCGKTPEEECKNPDGDKGRLSVSN